MKALIYILCVLAGAAYADEVLPDPFAPALKRAAELVQCTRGHKTLKEVPVVSGHVGALRSDPDTAAKADRGDIILGGCLAGNGFRVVCTTCALFYDDTYHAWQESFPLNPYASEGKNNPPCTATTIRQKFSKELQEISLDVAGEKSTFPVCSRWHDATGNTGEQVLIEAPVKTSVVQPKLEEWLQKMGGPKHPSAGILADTSLRWQWKEKGRIYEVELNASGSGGAFVVLEWHTIKKTSEIDAADGASPRN